ncbi:MAG: hypothetical protein ACRD2U_04630 [Terriglobales bacterium]
MEFDLLSNGRKVIWIGNEHLQIAVAEGGGHIAALHCRGMPETANPFWVPHWPSLEPSEVTDQIVEDHYGGAPEGRLLASILGHSLALDLYGAPSKEEAEAGAVTHGRVGVLPWKWELSGAAGLYGECEDSFAQLLFSRNLVVKGSCALIEERVKNLCAWDRPIAWQQHVSLGSRFCEDGFWSQSNCDLGATHPQSFGPGAELVPGSESRWPFSPRRSGGSFDYRVSLEANRVANDFTGFRVSPSSDLGSFVAGNKRFHFAIFYIWPRQFFPWMGIWDEKHARVLNPWEKRTSVRAYEFGVSPFPESRLDMLRRPSLLGLPTYLYLPGGRTLWVRYMLGAFAPVHEAGELEISDDTAKLISDGREIGLVELAGECASSERKEMRQV